MTTIIKTEAVSEIQTNAVGAPRKESPSGRRYQGRPHKGGEVRWNLILTDKDIAEGPSGQRTVRAHARTRAGKRRAFSGRGNLRRGWRRPAKELYKAGGA